MMAGAFWMVWGEGQGAPTYRHAAAVLAEVEAERLARKHPGVKFYILQAMQYRCLNDMGRVQLTEDDEILF